MNGNTTLDPAQQDDTPDTKHANDSQDWGALAFDTADEILPLLSNASVKAIPAVQQPTGQVPPSAATPAAQAAVPNKNIAAPSTKARNLPQGRYLCLLWTQADSNRLPPHCK
jgi:hypothetical protein